MSIEFFSFWTRETVSNIRRNRLMSLLAISTVTLGLFILGVFYLTLNNLQALLDSQTQKLDLTLVLERDITPQRRKQIYEAARIPQVADLQFASRSQVLKQWQKEMPDIPIADFRNNNPFGDELRIRLKDPNTLIAVSKYLNSIKGVQKTREELGPARKLLAINWFIRVAGVVTLCMLGMAILMIIHNSIRLTVFARRREIRIMELVGATPWFIRIPFLLEGIIYGIAGAGFAAAVLSALFLAIRRLDVEIVRALWLLRDSSVLVACVAWIAVAGLGFGFIGSWLSLSRSIGKAAHI
ncbi:MAG TPA: permease-like cell division protein FtsX [Abditibacteriaceae bacterium]|nr:permease-like cell division protein FtsX [Abditibacteriaceae bacterium]